MLLSASSESDFGLRRAEQDPSPVQQDSWSLGDFSHVLGLHKHFLEFQGKFSLSSPRQSCSASFPKGKFQIPIYRSPSKQTQPQTRLRSQKLVCSSCRNCSQTRGCCISSEIGDCLHPCNVTAAAAKPPQALRALGNT